MGSWADIDTATAEVAAEFDPSLLSVADAVALLPVLTRIKNRIAAAEALCGTRVAQSDRWRTSGSRTPAEHYAKATGQPMGQARDALAAGKAMGDSERLRQAALAGTVSPAQAGVIGDTATDVPDAVDDLLDLVEKANANGGGGAGSLTELKAAADTARAAADPDPEATARRIHDGRGLRQWVKAQRGFLYAAGSAMDTQWIAAQLEPLLDGLRRDARERGEVPSEEALRYDAMLLLLARGAGVDPPPHPHAEPEPQGPLGGSGDGSGAAAVPAPRTPTHDQPSRVSDTLDLFHQGEETDAADDAVYLEPDVTLWRGGSSAGDGADASPWRYADGTRGVDGASSPRADATTPETRAQPDLPTDPRLRDVRRVDTGRLAGGVLLDPPTGPGQPEPPDDEPPPWAGPPPRGGPPSPPAPPTPPRPGGGATHGARPGSQSRRGKAWSRATTIIRIDATAAQRGRALPGEICEMAGAGPLPVSAVQTALAEGSKLAIITTREDGSVDTVAHVRGDRVAGIDIRDPEVLAREHARAAMEVADLVHTGRRPNAHQRTALQWTSPTCTADGCSNPNCEMDHETGFAITKDTRLGDLDPLCRYHHRLKTLHGWALVPGHGKRAFVAPDDPRHPKNAG